MAEHKYLEEKNLGDDYPSILLLLTKLLSANALRKLFHSNNRTMQT